MTEQLNFDGWMNQAAGLNTVESVVGARRFRRSAGVDDEGLTAQYEGDWLARSIVRSDTEHAMRQGFTAEGVDLAEFNRLNYPDHIRDGYFEHAQHMANLHGTAVLILGVKSNSRDTTAQVVPQSSSLAWLDVATAHQIRVTKEFDDANSGNHGLPAEVEIVGDHRRRGLLLHTSRLIWFQGLPPSQEPTFAGRHKSFGTSILQPVQDELARFGLTWAAVSHLINEASIAVWKMKGLIASASSASQAEVNARMSLASRSKSVARTIFLDADHNESFDRTAVRFSDLPELIDRIMQVVAGAAKRPVSVLFGRHAAGLNSTGQHDLDNFYDELQVFQRYLKPKLELLLQFMAGSPTRPEVVFPSLKRMTDLEQAQLRKTLLEGDKILWDMNGVEGLEVVLSRAEDSTLGLDVDQTAKKAQLESEEDSEPAPDTDRDPSIPDEVVLTRE